MTAAGCVLAGLRLLLQMLERLIVFCLQFMFPVMVISVSACELRPLLHGLLGARRLTHRLPGPVETSWACCQRGPAARPQNPGVVTRVGHVTRH